MREKNKRQIKPVPRYQPAKWDDDIQGQNSSLILLSKIYNAIRSGSDDPFGIGTARAFVLNQLGISPENDAVRKFILTAQALSLLDIQEHNFEEDKDLMRLPNLRNENQIDSSIGEDDEEDIDNAGESLDPSTSDHESESEIKVIDTRKKSKLVVFDDDHSEEEMKASESESGDNDGSFGGFIVGDNEVITFEASNSDIELGISDVDEDTESDSEDVLSESEEKKCDEIMNILEGILKNNEKEDSVECPLCKGTVTVKVKNMERHFHKVHLRDFDGHKHRKSKKRKLKSAETKNAKRSKIELEEQNNDEALKT